MPQYARPTDDAFLGDCTDHAAGTTDVFQSIDEDVGSADNDNYIQSPVDPSSDPYVCKISQGGGIVDPEGIGTVTVRYVYGKDAAGGFLLDVTVELREGYVNEGSPGTLIATNTHTDIANGWNTGSFDLSGGEEATITDYDDLYLRFVFDKQ